jgi:hypothetical protein
MVSHGRINHITPINNWMNDRLIDSLAFCVYVCITVSVQDGNVYVWNVICICGAREILLLEIAPIECVSHTFKLCIIGTFVKYPATRIRIPSDSIILSAHTRSAHIIPIFSSACISVLVAVCSDSLWLRSLLYG